MIFQTKYLIPEVAAVPVLLQLANDSVRGPPAVHLHLLGVAVEGSVQPDELPAQRVRDVHLEPFLRPQVLSLEELCVLRSVQYFLAIGIEDLVLVVELVTLTIKLFVSDLLFRIILFVPVTISIT